jgi:3-hydroxyacyl-[acyl-carrier-protein] dehydratase
VEHAEIAALLPHRHPMILLDRIDAIEPGRSIRGTKTISATESCYVGLAGVSAPRAYAYPHSLMLESFGQAAAVLWLKTISADGIEPRTALLLAVVRKCIFHDNAYPGDVLRHDVRLVYRSAREAVVEGEIIVGDRAIGSISSMIAVKRPYE